VLPTAVAVSNLGAGTVLFTIAAFTLLYTVLFVIEMKLMLKTIRKGPEEHPVPPPAADPELAATQPRAPLAAPARG
jgi:cytochrome d ubiquinol oxidase subunit I